MITKRSAKQLKRNGKVYLSLPTNIREYSCSENEYKNMSKLEKNSLLYSYKFYGIDFRRRYVEKLLQNRTFSDGEMEYLANYLLECSKVYKILTKYKIDQINNFEIPFDGIDEKYAEQDFDINVDKSEECSNRNIKYREKQTKLYKLSRIPYDKNKSSWVTANVDNVFQFHGVFYQIDKSNKNYKCDAQNSSPMDKVFCAYCENGIEFYDMNIKKINVNKC